MMVTMKGLFLSFSQSRSLLLYFRSNWGRKRYSNFGGHLTSSWSQPTTHHWHKKHFQSRLPPLLAATKPRQTFLFWIYNWLHKPLTESQCAHSIQLSCLNTSHWKGLVSILLFSEGHLGSSVYWEAFLSQGILPCWKCRAVLTGAVDGWSSWWHSKMGWYDAWECTGCRAWLWLQAEGILGKDKTSTCFIVQWKNSNQQ